MLARSLPAQARSLACILVQQNLLFPFDMFYESNVHCATPSLFDVKGFWRLDVVHLCLHTPCQVGVWCYVLADAHVERHVVFACRFGEVTLLEPPKLRATRGHCHAIKSWLECPRSRWHGLHCVGLVFVAMKNAVET